MIKKITVPGTEIAQRIKTIQEELSKSGTEGVLIVQRVDLFYFSGTAQNGFLYIPVEGDPLLLIRRYAPRAREESPIKNIVEIKTPKELPGIISDMYGKLPSTLGFELDVIPVRDFEFYKSLFPAQDCQDLSDAILKVRMIKSPWEISRMRETAEVSRKTLEYARENLKSGYTEMEFATMFESYARSLGHAGKLRVRDYQTEGYPWHLLSGKCGGMLGVLDSPASGEGTSSAFPCGAGNKKLAPNEPIMIDFNCVVNGYHFDETRMFAINSMPQKALDASRAAIEIHDEVLHNVRPGVNVAELYEISVSKGEALGYGDSYLGPPGYKVAFIGHGIGTELIEQPIIAASRKDIMKEGMVFALEPKLVFENEFSAGVESVFLVTDKGHSLISKMPVEIFIC